jgi:exodeoxyribonuclease-5
MQQKSLVEEFEQRLRTAFPYEPTDGQERLLYVFSKFLFSDKERCALIIRGYAGTGKTTVTGAIVKALREMRRKVVLMAPTGRAAKVLSSFSDHPAYTIHRTIYNQAGTADSGVSFNLSANRRKDTLFIVDEASMIGDAAAMQSEGGFDHRDLLDDLMEYVFSGEGCRLLLIGDSAQLPPVGSDESPALNKQLLERRFFLTIAELELNEVVRQELDSGILFNANALRMQLQAGQTGFPRLDATGFPDLIRLGGEDLQDTIESLYGKYGEQEVAIITRSNKRANLFNQQVRNRILWREEDIAAGDLLMVVRNNYHWLTDYKDAPTSFIANGDTLEVQRVNKYQELYGLKFADVTVRMIDYPDFQPIDVKVMLDVIDLEKANLGFADLKKLYHAVAEDYMHLGNRRAIHQAIMKDPYYNALQIKFAYAVTCHKSQGGQWPAVIVDQGYLTEEMLDISLLRWFYTAFTRAQTELYLLNFSDEFF